MTMRIPLLLFIMFALCLRVVSQDPLIYNRVGIESHSSNNLTVVDSLGDPYGPRVNYNNYMYQWQLRQVSTQTLYFNLPQYYLETISLSPGNSTPRAVVREPVYFNVTGGQEIILTLTSVVESGDVVNTGNSVGYSHKEYEVSVTSVVAHEALLSMSLESGNDYFPVAVLGGRIGVNGYAKIVVTMPDLSVVEITNPTGNNPKAIESKDVLVSLPQGSSTFKVELYFEAIINHTEAVGAGATTSFYEKASGKFYLKPVKVGSNRVGSGEAIRNVPLLPTDNYKLFLSWTRGSGLGGVYGIFDASFLGNHGHIILNIMSAQTRVGMFVFSTRSDTIIYRDAQILNPQYVFGIIVNNNWSWLPSRVHISQPLGSTDIYCQFVSLSLHGGFARSSNLVYW